MPAYFLDRAVWYFGSTVEQDIQKAQDGKKGKAAEAAASLTLNKWLTELGETPRGFRDPAMSVRR